MRAAFLKPLDYFVARVPILAVEELTQVDPDARAGNAWLRYAVLVASPSLHEATTGSSPSRPISARAARSTRHYASRMALRPTPFGVFAGIAVCEWGTHATLSLATEHVRTRTRLDMGWLLAVVEELESRRDIFRQLRVRTNPSVIMVGGRVVLPEQSALDVGNGTVHRVSVRATRVVRSVLELTRTPIAVSELVAHTHSLLPAAPADRIEAMLDSLRASSILLTELRPPVTHGRPMGWVTDVLRSVQGAQDVLDPLDQIEACLARCDACAGAEQAERAVRRATNLTRRVVSEMIGNRPPPPVTPLQIDTAVRLDGTHLPSAVGWEAALAAEALLRCAPKPGTNALAERLTHEIQTRYGEWEFVSVRELMADGVLGRLFGESRMNSHSYRADTTGNLRRDGALIRLAEDAILRRATTVILDDAMLDELSQPIDRIPAPSTMEIFVSVAAKSARDVDEGRFSLVVGPGIGSMEAGRSLGRFTDMLAPHERDRVRAALEYGRATSGNYVDVELACLPREPRLANVAVRTVTAAHELSVGTWPGVPEDRVVGLHELEVGAPEGQLQVRWTRTGQRIRLTQATMLNPLWTPAICQVLQAASLAGEAHLAPFDWGPASGFPFLPRVVRGRSVLRTAEWRVDPKPLLGPVNQSAAEVSRWLDQLGVPELIHVVHGDNRLLINLGDPQSIRDLVVEAHAVAQRGNQLTLHEALPAPTDAWLSGPNGRHALELAVQLCGTRHPSDHAPHTAEPHERMAIPPHASPQRRVWPGEDWAYAKLYIQPEQQVEFLLGELQGFIAELTQEDVLASWFFIRHADPDRHVRLRLKTRVPGDGPLLLSRLASWITRVADLIGLQHMAFEPYVRELNRYGGADGMSLAESMFHADSVTTLGLLGAVHSSQPIDPVAVAVVSSFRLLTDLGVRPDRMRSWLPESADKHPDTGRTYRIRQTEMRALLAESNLTAQDWDGVRAALDYRTVAVAPLMAAATQAAAEGRLTVDLDRLARSHIHLHLNRFFGPNAEQERLTLGLLRRALRSADALLNYQG